VNRNKETAAGERTARLTATNARIVPAWTQHAIFLHPTVEPKFAYDGVDLSRKVSSKFEKITKPNKLVARCSLANTALAVCFEFFKP
jgi:hypothetical protein